MFVMKKGSEKVIFTPDNLEEVKKFIKEGFVIENGDVKRLCVTHLNSFTNRYFSSEAYSRGYYLDMGEITYDASQGDPDATFLKQLYDAVWEKEEELEAQLKQMSLEQLLELDLETWAKEAYNAVKSELENQQTEQTTEQ